MKLLNMPKMLDMTQYYWLH